MVEKLKIKMICNKCGTTFEWPWGRKYHLCPKCGPIHIRDTKLFPGEINKVFR